MSPTNEPTKRKVEINDLYRFRLLSDPQVSPDGHMVAYVQTRLRKKKNDYASNIWLVPADGSREPMKFTGSSKRDMSPKWSPKGDQIAFISTRSGKPQLWVIYTGGGTATLSTKLLWSFVQVLTERLRKTTADLSGARLEAQAEDLSAEALFEEAASASAIPQPPPAVEKDKPAEKKPAEAKPN